jgi:outer membrane protein OmpA-like peptidoglycan-associated protein
MARLRSAILVALVMSACADRQALFVVLPNEDGTVGAITVDDGKKATVLDRAYAAEEIRGGSGDKVSVDQSDVQKVFAPALAARPMPPRHFRLYFQLDSDQLVPSSEAEYRNFFEEVKKRPVFEVEVIGYTDTLGAKDYNQDLSLHRAIAIRERLIEDGLDIRASTIVATGRGQLDPLIPTKDQVSEPRNRRVEITVR